LGGRDLMVLPGWQTKLSDRDCLSIKGDSLFTGYVTCSGNVCELVDPKQEGWFTSEDVVKHVDNKIWVKGRVDRCVKILGELVNLSEVEAKVEAKLESSEKFKQLAGNIAVVALPDSRKGYQLILCSEESSDLDQICKHYNVDSHPVERLEGICVVSEIPRSPLGKVRHGLLASKVTDQLKQMKQNDR